jgi:ribonuclease-3
MAKLSELTEKLGVTFKNPELLQQAFVHRSYLNEHSFALGHNEKLEFLGDAVLELIVTEFLYKKFTDKTEGELTPLRSALVKGDTLSIIATELEFHKYLQLSKGEAKTVANQTTILANTFEAFVGALFLDAGMSACEKFIHQFLLPKLESIINEQAYIDAKSYFQELAQEKENVTPTYQVVNEWGPDHSKTFEVAVYLGDQEIARGTGNSKQVAELDAASHALKVFDLTDRS